LRLYVRALTRTAFVLASVVALAACSPALSGGGSTPGGGVDADLELDGLDLGSNPTALWMEIRSYQGCSDCNAWVSRSHSLVVTDIPDLCAASQEAFGTIETDFADEWLTMWEVVYTEGSVRHCELRRELYLAVPGFADLFPMGGQRLEFVLPTQSFENVGDEDIETTGLPEAGTWGPGEFTTSLTRYEQSMEDWLAGIDCYADPDPFKAPNVEGSGGELTVEEGDGDVFVTVSANELDGGTLELRGTFEHCPVQLPPYPVY
jgi:hypothetical protein